MKHHEHARINNLVALEKISIKYRRLRKKYYKLLWEKKELIRCMEAKA